MKIFLKRNLALLLVLCTILSVCPLNVLAADEALELPEVQETAEEASVAVEPVEVDTEEETDLLGTNVGTTEGDGEASLTCGDSLTWSLEDGVLTISGTGIMDSFEDGTQPWADSLSRITALVVEAGVTSIGDYAFYGCSNLTSVDLGYTISYIGDYAFYGCSGLTEIELPSSVHTLREYAFYGCSGLTNIAIPDGVYDLPESYGIYTQTYFCSVFAGCTSLKSVEIGAHLQTLCTGTFASSPELTEATFKNASTVIEDYAVGYHETASGYAANGDVRILGHADSTAKVYAESNGFTFTDLDSAPETNSCGESLTWAISDGVLTISGEGPMTTYTSYRSVPWYSSRDSISAVVVEEGVTGISPYAFYDCSALTSAALPDSLTSIGKYAFYNCVSLTDITIPPLVTVIENNTFLECTSLQTVFISNGVTTIGKQAFGIISAVYDSDGNALSCGSLQEVTLPDSITGISSSAFYGNYNTDAYYCTEGSVGHTYATENGMTPIQHYWDEGTITTAVSFGVAGEKTFSCKLCDETYVEPITVYAYGSCGEDLEWSMSYDGTLTISGTGDMYDYTAETQPFGAFREAIETVVMDSGITGIGDYAFYGCSALKQITIPENVTSIGDCAFSGSALERVTVPAGVTHIGSLVFASCSGLTEITVDADNTVYASEDGVLFNHAKTTLIAAPGSISGAYTIPSGVSAIASGAFAGCRSLTEITIPTSITSIGEYAFSRCDRLMEVYYRGSQSGWDKISIGSNNDPLAEALLYCALVSHSFGDGLVWELTEEGVLTISGEGEIPDFQENTQPWADVRSDITTVIVESGITAVGRYAFSGCVNMTDVSLPSTVTVLGDYAFYGCSSLTGVAIPDGVSELGWYDHVYTGTYYCSVFTDCTSLASVEIGAKLEILYADTFATNQNLTEVTFRSPTTVIKEHAVGYTETTAGYIPNGDVVIIGYSGSTAQTYAESNGFTFTSLDALTASGSCGERLTWAISEGVLTISGEGDMTAYATYRSVPWYSYRSSIGAVVVEEGVTSISAYAFYGCTEMTSATLPETVSSIGAWAFNDCEGLTEILIPAAVTVIEESTFYECTGLTRVVMGGNVVSIGARAFGVTSIVYDSENNANSCGSLSEVTLPDSLTSISDSAFYGHTDMTAYYCTEGSVGHTYATENGMSLIQHYWDEGVISVPPTTTTTGTKVYTCVMCGETYSITLSVNGLRQVSGVWGYYLNGELQTGFTGLIKHTNGIWYYIQNGLINWGYTGLVYHCGSWWYVQAGRLDSTYRGLAYYNGSWWYVNTGKVYYYYTGLFKHTNGIWYYIEGGRINWSYTGLIYHSNSWWYISSGRLDSTYLGLAYYNGSWWYVKNGKVDFSYTGYVLHQGTYRYVKAGKAV